MDRCHQHMTTGTHNGGSKVGHRFSMRHMISVWVLGLAAFITVLSWAQQGSAAPATTSSDEQRPTPQTLTMQGEVLAVDTAARTLRVRLEDGSEQTVQVDQKAMIFVKARLRSLSDVQPPQWVGIDYVEQGGRRIAMSIVGFHRPPPANPRVAGKVVAVDMKARTLRIRTQDGKKQTFQIGDETWVNLRGRRYDFDEVRIGRQVEIEYTEQNGARLTRKITIIPPGPPVRRLPPAQEEPTS